MSKHALSRDEHVSHARAMTKAVMGKSYFWCWPLCSSDERLIRYGHTIEKGSRNLLNVPARLAANHLSNLYHPARPKLGCLRYFHAVDPQTSSELGSRVDNVVLVEAAVAM